MVKYSRPKRKHSSGKAVGKHGKSIKRPDIYEALRGKGMSKSMAARISNAMARRGGGRRGKGKRKR